MKEFIITWDIQNIIYSWHRKSGEIISPPFVAVPLKNSLWYLHLNPRSRTDDDYISLFLQRGPDRCSEEISINFELSFMSFDKSPLHSYFFPEADLYFEHNASFGHPRFLRRHEVFVQRKSLYLPRDTLTVRCRMWKDEGNISKYEESFGVTCLDIERIVTLNNIEPLIGAENTVFIHSKRRNKKLITINLLNYENEIKVVINPTTNINIEFSVLKLIFVKKTNRKILCEHRSSFLGKPVQEKWRLNVEFLNDEKEDSDENEIELHSEFTYSTGQESETLVKYGTYPSRSAEVVSKYIDSCISSTISKDLWNLYMEHVLCDLEIKTKTSSFLVHKIVLCARSSVFLAMLTDDMREKRSKCIQIEDIADDILMKFLFFLYTDIFDDVEWEKVIDLYYAADKYNVQRLKILCCSFFLKNINVDNVCELLLLADKHNDSDFKTRVEIFILQNEEKIFSSSIWMQFINEQSLLSAMTMQLKYEKEKGKRKVTAHEDYLSLCPDILEDFICAYESEMLSDVIINTKGKTFHAHKSVLCASSSTWKKAFSIDSEDKDFHTIELEDLGDDTVSRLLLFLYSDFLENIEWDNAIELYKAANLFEIQRLKIKCSCILLENLVTYNACNLLLLAHQYSDTKLKSVVKDFIILHDEEIFGSDEWAEFSKANLLLANETMCLKYQKSTNFFNFTEF